MQSTALSQDSLIMLSPRLRLALQSFSNLFSQSSSISESSSSSYSNSSLSSSTTSQGSIENSLPTLKEKEVVMSVMSAPSSQKQQDKKKHYHHDPNVLPRPVPQLISQEILQKRVEEKKKKRQREESEENALNTKKQKQQIQDQWPRSHELDESLHSLDRLHASNSSRPFRLLPMCECSNYTKCLYHLLDKTEESKFKSELLEVLDKFNEEDGSYQSLEAKRVFVGYRSDVGCPDHTGIDICQECGWNKLLEDLNKLHTYVERSTKGTIELIKKSQTK